MKRAILFVFILLSCSASAQAAFDNLGSSAKSLSLANACVALTDEPSVFSINPGALGFLQGKGFQASISRLYQLDELSERELYLAVPFRRLVLGAGLYVFGKSGYYQESMFSLALGYAIKDRVSLGANFKYMRISFSDEYEALSAFSVDVGSTFKVNPEIQLGLAAKNISQPELVKHSDDIPTNVSFGLAVFPFEEVTLLLDLSYEERYKEQLHLGQEIRLLKNLPLRFGIQTSPACYALGAGFNFDKLLFDYAYSNHSVLGDTHKISFSYRWGSKK
ncbi:MAG: hypothetical protein WBC88_05240 [Candidatus Zixiibacteriota bacterium]